MESTSVPLTLEEFTDRMRSEFGVPGALTSTALLVAEVGFDSLGMLELVLFIEELVSGDRAEILLEYPTMVTVEDGFDLYLRLFAWVEDDLRSE